MTVELQGVEAAGPSTGTGRLASLSLGPFELDIGTTLANLVVAYRHDGPGPGFAPQILVIHALTGSADARMASRRRASSSVTTGIAPISSRV